MLDHVLGLCSSIDGHQCQYNDDLTNEQLKQQVKDVFTDLVNATSPSRVDDIYGPMIGKEVLLEKIDEL